MATKPAAKKDTAKKASTTGKVVSRSVRQARQAVKKATTPEEKKEARQDLKVAKRDQKTPAEYGFARAFLKTHPDIAKVVDRAIKGEWTPERFQDAIKGTEWYKTHTEAQRKADLLASSDPKGYEQALDEARQDLTRAAAAAGVTLSDSDLDTAVNLYVRNGWDGADVREWIGDRYTFNEQASGQAAASVDDIRSMAQAYGMNLSSGTLQTYVRSVLSGRDTIDGIQDRLREQAKVLFPGASTWLDNGQTIADIASPYLEYASRLLNKPVASMDLSDPKWQKMLNGGQNGAMLSLEQFGKALRSDSQYGWDRSLDARQTATNLANGLAKIMGRSA